MTNYKLLVEKTLALANASREPVPVMANVSALLFESMEEISWAGFYTVKGDVLLLGPFQGKVACVTIAKGKGVCGTAWAENKTLVVPDVHAFPGHIACDSTSRSEIVLPVRRDGQVFAVLDIDSRTPARFGKDDAAGLSELVAALDRIIGA